MLMPIMTAFVLVSVQCKKTGMRAIANFAISSSSCFLGLFGLNPYCDVTNDPLQTQDTGQTN